MDQCNNTESNNTEDKGEDIKEEEDQEEADKDEDMEEDKVEGEEATTGTKNRETMTTISHRTFWNHSHQDREL